MAASTLIVMACGTDASPTGETAVEPAQVTTAETARADGPTGPGQWHQMESMRVPRSEAPAAVLDGRIYFAGGLNSTGRTQAFDTVEVFDPTTNTWSAVAPMPERRHHLMIAAHNGAIYVFGGLSEGGWVPQANTWRYDPASDAWTSLTEMPAPVGAGAAVTLGDSIFVMAGVGHPQALFEFDPAESTWKERASLPVPLEHFAAAVIGQQIFVSGGRWSGAGEADAVYRYDPATDNWSPVAPMTEARAGHALASTGRALVAIGGEILASRRALDTVEIYDAGTNTWTPGLHLPRPTHGVAAVAIANTIYAVGGAPDAARANALGEVYALLP